MILLEKNLNEFEMEKSLVDIESLGEAIISQNESVEVSLKSLLCRR